MAGTTSTRGKVLATILAVGGAAAVAGFGTFGAFTSTTSASTPVSAGTVSIALGADGTAANRLSVGASGLVPGDTVQRAVDLVNDGPDDLGGVTLSTTGGGSLLTTDAAMGLQLQIEECATGWVEAGTAPAYTYSCASPATVLASQPVLGTDVPLTLASLGAGTSHLRVTLTLPAAADNTLQGLSDTVAFAFTGTQRAAGSR